MAIDQERAREWLRKQPGEPLEGNEDDWLRADKVELWAVNMLAAYAAECVTAERKRCAEIALGAEFKFQLEPLSKYRAELLARLSQGERWQLTGTAPKDGSHILAADFSGNGVGFGGDPQQSWQDVVHYWQWADGTHRDEWGWYPSYGSTEQALTNLTHWKPLQELTLPAPPSEPSREQDCDCPCDMCAIGTGKHCGEPPCDVTGGNQPREGSEG